MKRRSNTKIDKVFTHKVSKTNEDNLTSFEALRFAALNLHLTNFGPIICHQEVVVETFPKNVDSDTNHQPHPFQIEISGSKDKKELKEQKMDIKSQNYIDLGPYLSMPQSEVAKQLGLPASTLSKRWKEAVPGRKWPHRVLNQIDKDIITLLFQIEKEVFSEDISNKEKVFTEEMEVSLGMLLRKRQKELKPVTIRL